MSTGQPWYCGVCERVYKLSTPEIPSTGVYICRLCPTNPNPPADLSTEVYARYKDRKRRECKQYARYTVQAAVCNRELFEDTRDIFRLVNKATKPFADLHAAFHDREKEWVRDRKTDWRAEYTAAGARREKFLVEAEEHGGRQVVAIKRWWGQLQRDEWSMNNKRGKRDIRDLLRSGRLAPEEEYESGAEFGPGRKRPGLKAKWENFKRKLF